MWKDEMDNMLDILDELDKEVVEFPSVCPICRSIEAHLYMHKDNIENIGGLWVWCSKCKNYIHATYHIPEGWINNPEIKESELSPTPEYLEINKENIDTWVKKIFLKKNNAIK